MFLLSPQIIRPQFLQNGRKCILAFYVFQMLFVFFRKKIDSKKTGDKNGSGKGFKMKLGKATFALLFLITIFFNVHINQTT